MVLHSWANPGIAEADSFKSTNKSDEPSQGVPISATKSVGELDLPQELVCQVMQNLHRLTFNPLFSYNRIGFH